MVPPRSAGDFLVSHLPKWFRLEIASTPVDQHAPPDGDMTAYLASLDVLSAACTENRIEFILPAHGYVIGGYATEATDVIARLKAHRLKREAKIVKVMQARPQGTLDDWLAEVYDDVPPRMCPWPNARCWRISRGLKPIYP